MLLSGLGDRKKLATEIVIGIGKKPSFSDRKEKGYSESNVSNEESDKDYTEYEMMAEEMMSAFEKKDVEALASTLKAFYNMCIPGRMGNMEEMDEE